VLYPWKWVTWFSEVGESLPAGPRKAFDTWRRSRAPQGLSTIFWRGDRDVHARASVPASIVNAEAILEDRFRRYYRDLVGLAMRYVDDVHEADEVVQEAFWRHYHDQVLIRPDREAYAWLCRVTVNLALNSIRGRRREAARLDQVARQGEAVRIASQNELDPADQLIRREQRAAVRHVLLEMPERARTCLVLRHNGLSYVEIASVLRVAIGSVGTLLARAEREFTSRWDERLQSSNDLGRGKGGSDGL